MVSRLILESTLVASCVIKCENVCTLAWFAVLEVDSLWDCSMVFWNLVYSKVHWFCKLKFKLTWMFSNYFIVEISRYLS